VRELQNLIERAVLTSTADGAAEVLGLHANTLRYRMKKLGIRVGRNSGIVSIDS